MARINITQQNDCGVTTFEPPWGFSTTYEYQARRRRSTGSHSVFLWFSHENQMFQPMLGFHNWLMGKSQFLMGKSTISMAIFHTLNYQRVLYVQQNWLHTTSPMVALLLILCFFHVWAFRYTTPISRQKRWRSMFHKFLHGWRGTTIDLEITFDILWCKSSLCLRNMCLILWSWLGKYTCSTIFIHFLYPHPANLSNVSHSASRDSSEAFSVDADGKLSPLNTATWWTTASCSMARMQHRYNTIRTYEWKWMNIYIYMYTIYIAIYNN